MGNPLQIRQRGKQSGIRKTRKNFPRGTIGYELERKGFKRDKKTLDWFKDGKPLTKSMRKKLGF